MKPREQTEQIVLIYNADAGFSGVAADVLKKLAGREDCALCEITHSAVGKRQAWASCERALSLPVVALHRNDMPRDWKVPLPAVVLARGDTLLRVLLGTAAIDDCRKDAGRLREKIEERLVGAVGIEPTTSTV